MKEAGAAAGPDRYARQRLLKGWDQEQLSNATVVVAGAGAIGNEAIKLLALLGVGRILVVDFDTVEPANLAKSVLFRAGDAGRPKASTAAERARELNPEIEVAAVCGDLEFDVGLGLYREADLVLGCLDSLDARLALNRACLRVGTPWLNGAIGAELAEVTLFGATGACFECGMTSEMWRRRRERFSCGGLRSSDPEPFAPTTAITAGLAAAYQVQEAVRLLQCRAAEDKRGLQFGAKVSVNLEPYHTAPYVLSRNPECLAHDPIEALDGLLEDAAAATVQSVLRSAGAPDGSVELAFDLVIEMRCVRCASSETMVLPLARCMAELRWCSACGANSRAPETATSLDSSHPLATAPLAQLGIPDHQILCVRSGDERRWYQLGGESPWNQGIQG